MSFTEKMRSSKFDRHNNSTKCVIFKYNTVTPGTWLLFCYCVVGYRAAEERRATMGQEVQVDEPEGGLWTPVLHSMV